MFHHLFSKCPISKERVANISILPGTVLEIIMKFEMGDFHHNLSGSSDYPPY
jgi:hypothetical protein